jgi:hypothetical protein
MSVEGRVVRRHSPNMAYAPQSLRNLSASLRDHRQMLWRVAEAALSSGKMRQHPDEARKKTNAVTALGSSAARRRRGGRWTPATLLAQSRDPLLSQQVDAALRRHRALGAVEGTAQPQSGRVKPSAGVKGHLFVMTRIVAPLGSVRCTYFKPERKL